MKDWEG